MKNVAHGVLAGSIGYLVVALLGYFFISIYSSNGHDREMEASMTSIFVLGPVGFIVFFIAGYFRAKKSGTS